MPAVALAIALLVGAGAPLSAVERTNPPAWDLWPYQVHVLLTVERGAEIAPSFEEELSPWLKAKVAAAVGGMWKLEISSAAENLRQKLIAEIDSLTADDITSALKKGDKLIFAAVRRTDGGWQVRAREYDVITGLWNSTISRDVRQLDLVRHETFQAIMAAFAPLARVEEAGGENVTLRLRASALAPGGRMPLSDGAVFRPVLVESDPSGVVTPGNATPIGWTYLTPVDKSRPLVKCRMQTALSGTVIPAYHPLRQRWALAVAPSSTAIRLRLVTRADAEPIEGCQVVTLELSPAGGTAKETTIGHTDRRGEVELPADSRPVRLVEVRHGGEVLARVPFAAGMAGEVTLPVDFDRKRLALETALSQLADDLIDLTARREVLSARIRAAEQGGKSDDAATLRQQLREINGTDMMLSRLDKLQQQVQGASPGTQKRIEERITSLRKMIAQLKSPRAAAK